MPNHDEEFVAFVETHSSALLRFAWGLTHHRETAEDTVQDALQRVYLRWRAIEGQPLAYAKKAIVNRHLDTIKRRKVLRFVSIAPGVDPAEPGTTDPDQRVTLLTALDRLPARERAVVSLRYLLDLPEREVANLLDIHVGTVKTSASRGIAKLRTALALTWEGAIHE